MNCFQILIHAQAINNLFVVNPVQPSEILKHLETILLNKYFSINLHLFFMFVIVIYIYIWTGRFSSIFSQGNTYCIKL